VAETDLGYLYEQGKGVPLDYVIAYKWYRVGVAGGDSRGIARINSLSGIMRPGDVADAKSLALAYLLRRGKGSEGLDTESKASMFDSH
jgi:TPR repeat protein